MAEAGAAMANTLSVAGVEFTDDSSAAEEKLDFFVGLRIRRA
jgi:hypothetical protein